MSDKPLHSIGGNLLREAQAKKKSPKHLVSELFPFIFEATPAMSTREISDWLKKEHEVTLSFVAIAKALRESGYHWEEFASEIESFAGIVEDAIGIEQSAFMFNEPVFDRGVAEFCFVTAGPNGPDQEKSDFAQAVSMLNCRWFVLSPATRRECAPYLNRLWEFRAFEKEAASRASQSSTAETQDQGGEASVDGED